MKWPKRCVTVKEHREGKRRFGGAKAAASEHDAKSDKGAELGMIRIKKVEEVRSE